MKTTDLLARMEQWGKPLTSVWQKCVHAGAREIEEMRAKPGPSCPHCGGHLILRRVGFGREAGRQYWDCSNVPRCSLSLAAEEVSWPLAGASSAAAVGA